jgi:hypothetical protein
MKTLTKTTAAPVPAPTEGDIREYAYHLYCQGGCAPGHDVDNWLEAEACLCEEIPQNSSHQRLHRHLQNQGKVVALKPVAA